MKSPDFRRKAKSMSAPATYAGSDGWLSAQSLIFFNRLGEAASVGQKLHTKT
jgi:hypothetical protein